MPYEITLLELQRPVKLQNLKATNGPNGNHLYRFPKHKKNKGGTKKWHNNLCTPQIYSMQHSIGHKDMWLPK